MRSSQTPWLGLLFICGRDLQLGAIAALHMDAQIDPPRTERYCPLSSSLLTAWNSVLPQSHCSQVWRHVFVSGPHGPTIYLVKPVQAVVWANLPTVGSEVSAFVLHSTLLMPHVQLCCYSLLSPIMVDECFRRSGGVTFLDSISLLLCSEGTRCTHMFFDSN